MAAKRPFAHTFWGYAARGLGQVEEAWHYFRLALQTAVDIHAIIPLLFGLPGMALLLADRGETERAAAVYAPLQAVPMIANSQLRADLAVKELAALVETVPAETTDLWALAEALLVETAVD